MVVHHILEVYELLKSSSESSTNSTEQQQSEAPTGRKGYLSKSKELTDEQEMYLEALKDAGATIKVLSSSGSILAIFKTASAAKQALGTHCQHSLPQLATHTTPHTESIQSPYFKLRRWTTPAATPPVSGTVICLLLSMLMLTAPTQTQQLLRSRWVKQHGKQKEAHRVLQKSLRTRRRSAIHESLLCCAKRHLIHNPPSNKERRKKKNSGREQGVLLILALGCSSSGCSG